MSTKTRTKAILDIFEHHVGRKNKLAAETFAQEVGISVFQLWRQIKQLKAKNDLPFIIAGDDIIGFWISYGKHVKATAFMNEIKQRSKAERTSQRKVGGNINTNPLHAYLKPRGKIYGGR